MKRLKDKRLSKTPCILNHVELKNYTKFLKSLPDKVHIVKPAKIKQATSALANEAVCFTGFRDKLAEAAIIKNGGSIASGVTQKTTLLVMADINSGSSKAEKARSLGIKIISKEKFENWLKSRGCAL